MLQSDTVGLFFKYLKLVVWWWGSQCLSTMDLTVGPFQWKIPVLLHLVFFLGLASLSRKDCLNIFKDCLLSTVLGTSQGRRLGWQSIKYLRTLSNIFFYNAPVFKLHTLNYAWFSQPQQPYIVYFPPNIILQCCPGVEEGIWRVNCFFQKTFIYTIGFSPHLPFTPIILWCCQFLSLLRIPKCNMAFLFTIPVKSPPPILSSFESAFQCLSQILWGDLLFSVFSLLIAL